MAIQQAFPPVRKAILPASGQQTLWRALLMLASCAALAYSCWFTWRVRIPEAFGDFWGWIDQFQLWTAGHFTFHELIKPWNEHRIATARIVFLLDSIWFRMEGVLPAIVTVASLSLTGALIGRLGQAGNEQRASRMLPSVFWVAWMAATCQADNLQFPFQVQFALLVLFAVTSAILLAIAARATPVRAAIAGFLSSIFFVLTTFSMAAGILLAPMLVAICVIRRARWQAILAWAPLSMAGLILFLHGYQPPDRHRLAIPEFIPYRFYFVVDFLASCFKALPSLAPWIGLAGLLLFALLSVRILRRTRHTGVPAPEAALMAIAGFVILCGLSGALTDRVKFLWGAALATRYASLGLLYFAAIGLLALRTVRAPPLSQTGQALTAVIGCAALAAVNLPVYLRDASAVVPLIKSNDELMANNVGVEGPMPLFFGPFIADLGGPTSFLHAHRLNMFSPHLRPPARALAAIATASSAPPCLGYLDHVVPIDDHAILLDGWMALSRKRMISWVVARENGAVIGAAQPFEPRPDIGAALSPRTQALGFKAGFRLTDPAPPGGTPRHLDLFGIAPGKQPSICMLPGGASIGPIRVTPLQYLSHVQPVPHPTVQTGTALPAADMPFLPAAFSGLAIWKISSGQLGHLVFSIAQPIPAGSALILPFQDRSDAALRRVTFRFADGAAYGTDLYWPWYKPQALGAVLPASILAAHPAPISVEATIAPGPDMFIGAPLAGEIAADWSKMY